MNVSTVGRVDLIMKKTILTNNLFAIWWGKRRVNNLYGQYYSVINRTGRIIYKFTYE